MLFSSAIVLLFLKLVSTMPASAPPLSTKPQSISYADNPNHMHKRDLADLFNELNADKESPTGTMSAPPRHTPNTNSERLPLPDQIESQLSEALHGTTTKSLSATSSDTSSTSESSTSESAAPTTYSVIGQPSTTAVPTTTTTIDESSLLDRVQGTEQSVLPSATSTASSSNSSESTEAHRWKVAGIVLIFVALIVVLCLSVVFFDAWTRFLRDVLLGRRGKRGGLGRWRGGRWGRNEPELVVDWEKREWEYQLASEDGHRYPSLDGGLNKMAGKDNTVMVEGSNVVGRERVREKVKGVVRAEEGDDDMENAYEATAMAPAVPAASYPHANGHRTAGGYPAGLGVAS